MPQPLATAALPDRPGTPAWLSPWIVAALNVGLFGAVMFTAPVPACTVEQPCGPSLPATGFLGLWAAVVVVVFLDARIAAWVAMTLAAGAVLGELVEPGEFGWIFVVAFAALAAYTVVVAQTRHAAYEEPATLTAAPREPVNSGQSPPGPRTRWVVLGVLGLVASALLAYSQYIGDREAGRESAATRVNGTVVDHVDNGLKIRVDLEDRDGTVDVAVLDVNGYPEGSRTDFWVDGDGLVRPVAEPYDGTFWVFPAIILLALSLAGLLRLAHDRTALRELVTVPQPAFLVHARLGGEHAWIYAHDADGTDEAFLSIEMMTHPFWPLGEVQRDVTLYGYPQPGRWCALRIGGKVLLPQSPAQADDGMPFELPEWAEDFDEDDD